MYVVFNSMYAVIVGEQYLKTELGVYDGVEISYTVSEFYDRWMLYRRTYARCQVYGMLFLLAWLCGVEEACTGTEGSSRRKTTDSVLHAKTNFNAWLSVWWRRHEQRIKRIPEKEAKTTYPHTNETCRSPQQAEIGGKRTAGRATAAPTPGGCGRTLPPDFFFGCGGGHAVYRDPPGVAVSESIQEQPAADSPRFRGNVSCYRMVPIYSEPTTWVLLPQQIVVVVVLARLATSSLKLSFEGGRGGQRRRPVFLTVLFSLCLTPIHQCVNRCSQCS